MIVGNIRGTTGRRLAEIRLFCLPRNKPEKQPTRAALGPALDRTQDSGPSRWNALGLERLRCRS